MGWAYVDGTKVWHHDKQIERIVGYRSTPKTAGIRKPWAEASVFDCGLVFLAGSAPGTGDEFYGKWGWMPEETAVEWIRNTSGARCGKCLALFRP